DDQEIHAGGGKRPAAGVVGAPQHRRDRRRGASQPIRFHRRTRAAPLPNASFIGFTGTPIEKTDANTRAVFGDYISIYDIQRAVADEATVPIYYESRVAKLRLNASELPKIDKEFEEITEGEELPRKEK